MKNTHNELVYYICANIQENKTTKIYEKKGESFDRENRRKIDRKRLGWKKQENYVEECLVVIVKNCMAVF